MNGRATEIVKEAVAAVLKPGDFAIDATVGNGHDTLFLCEQVAPNGLVFGFDIQAVAIAATGQHLKQAGIDPDLHTLFDCGHEDLEFFCNTRMATAIMFNLGYLPGGDKTLITRPETTLAALNHALPLLLPGGLLTIVCYPGHKGGDEEAEAVRNWARTLDEGWQVAVQTTDRDDVPFAVVVQSVA